MPNHSILLKIRRKPALITAAVCLLAVFIAMTVYLCLPMPEGAALDGFDLSGKPYWKARAEARTIRPQPLRLSLRSEELTFSDSGVKFDMGSAVRAARKQGGNVSLRPYLKADEAAIREKLTAYAEKYDTTCRQAEWRLVGTAPELSTDRFDPKAEGQTLVVNVGVPEAHLDVEGVLSAVLDAFARPLSAPEGRIAAVVKPTKYPEMPDWEALAAEVYMEPVNDAPNRETGGILPGRYGQSIDVSSYLDSQPGYGHTVAFPLIYTAPDIMGEDTLFQDILGEYETKHNTNENRNNNLRLLCQALDGHIVEPGETFSYNQVVGERTAEKGYLPAPAYSGNHLVDAIGGGVCQGSTTLYNCVLLADLEVVFRACHGAKVTYVPPGLDATVNYLTTDFQFRNQYHFPVKIRAEVSDGYVKMKLLGTDEKDYYVKMETTSGEDELAVYARSFKCKYDKQTDELLSREIEAYSTYYKNIG